MPSVVFGSEQTLDRQFLSLTSSHSATHLGKSAIRHAILVCIVNDLLE